MTRKMIAIDCELAAKLRTYAELKHGFCHGSIKAAASIQKHVMGEGSENIEYINVLWNSLHYKLRIVIFLSGVFELTFLIISKFLIEYGQGNDSIKIAIGVSGVLTAAALNKIDLFVTREK